MRTCGTRSAFPRVGRRPHKGGCNLNTHIGGVGTFRIYYTFVQNLVSWDCWYAEVGHSLKQTNKQKVGKHWTRCLLFNLFFFHYLFVYLLMPYFRFFVRYLSCFLLLLLHHLQPASCSACYLGPGKDTRSNTNCQEPLTNNETQSRPRQPIF